MIKYRKGYKYQLAEDMTFFLKFYSNVDIKLDFIEFYTTGKFIIKKGYAWDGPSGPTWDDETNMQGSCLHDAGYQLMRAGFLDELIYRDLFDKLFEQICIEDGMSHFRASYYFEGIHLFGEQYAKRQDDAILITGK